MNYSIAADFLNIEWLSVKEYVFTLFLTIVVTYGLLFFLRFSLHQFFKRTNYINEKQEGTIESVFKTSSNYLGFFIVLITAVKPFIEIKELLVAGGVLGIVIGFGAQSAIKDMLYGFFFLFEGQFKKGDFVRINEELDGGTVEELGFRALKIRKLNGMVTTISNGEVRKIVNGNVESRRIYESVIVSFRQNPQEVKELLNGLCEQLNEQHQPYLKKDREGQVVEQYRVHGLSSLDSSPLGYKFTIVATVTDSDYITAVQETKEIIAQAFFDRNIKMPEQQIAYKTE
ncbi:mechanosensitive ion channel family protein [Bacillus taeanensis]|uniref:Mechanosensitive ion channel family protein n=1 Tax=Bacillus taeanensis TaxID=273032 RepID=A0A366XWU7_9BACI|nr:mechanosensitive ion channel domain-containing protein [Bacillus taeanensis]RBW69239.1 mechanosensitive ion channel family protein [Bacillus taeanensis]